MLDDEEHWNTDVHSTRSESSSSQSHRGGLNSEHLDPIACRQWKTVLSWIAFHPDQVANLVDREGQTALHHACLFRAPANVVEAMLYAAPELASICNDEDELALHWAVRLNLPLEVMKLLLNACPTTGFVPDKSGHTPMSLLWDRHDDTLMDVFRIYGREKTTSFASWKRMLMLVQAATGEDIVTEFPLHAIASCACPPSFLRFAIEVCRDDLSVTDDKGRLPLHVVAARKSFAPEIDQKSIETLLKAYPEAVSTPDADGRLPINLAIVAGKSWKEGIEILMDAAPTVLSQPDSKSHLYPFMLAATRCAEDYEDDYGLRDTQCVTNVFSLLREYPALIDTRQF